MRDRITFIHAADLHLDAPFQGIRADDETVGRTLAASTYTALSRIVDTCLERDVDFLVIAGDAYNSAAKSLRAQLAFRTEMQRLAAADIDVFVVHGNHDPASGWSAGLVLPDNVHVFAADRVERVPVVRDGEVVAAVYGRSFAKAAETGNLAKGFVREEGDPVAIAVLHANVGGDPDYDPYAPASLEDLRASRMDYWALGHIHKHEILARDPWVVYAGSPQGLNPKETGEHGCAVVEMGGGGVLNFEYVETAPVAWDRHDISAESAETIDQVATLLSDACAQARRTSGRPCILRIGITGRCAAHADLVRPGVLDQLLEELRSDQMATDPWVWLDRVDASTASPIDLDAVRGGPDFSAELVRIADELATEGSSLDEIVAEIVAPVAASLAGYPGPDDAREALDRARDEALDLLLTKDGE